MGAAPAIASSREGSSSTVKPPLSGGAHEYPPAENVPSAETSTGGTASSIPPPKTYTPAAFASSITACASRPTASHSPSGTTIAALGKEIRYLAIVFSLSSSECPLTPFLSAETSATCLLCSLTAWHSAAASAPQPAFKMQTILCAKRSAATTITAGRDFPPEKPSYPIQSLVKIRRFLTNLPAATSSVDYGRNCPI